MPKGSLIPRPKPIKQAAEDISATASAAEEKLKAEITEHKRRLNQCLDEMKERVTNVSSSLRNIGVSEQDISFAQKATTGGTGGGPKPARETAPTPSEAPSTDTPSTGPTSGGGSPGSGG